MGEVDPAFIQEPEHRPSLTVTEAEGVPLIDLSPITNSKNNDSSAAIEGLVKEIGSACKKWGFFQVINHGAPLDHRRRIEAAAKKFFAQSLEEKRKVRRDEVRPLGYYDTAHKECKRLEGSV